MHAAVDLDLARHRGVPAQLPDPDRLHQAWSLPYDDASSIAARDRVLRAWWTAGLHAEVAAALGGTVPPDGSAHRVSDLLWRARLAMGERDAGARVPSLTREALAAARRRSAAWWVSQALELLEAAGAASAEEHDERARIEAALRGGSQRGA